MSCWNGWVQAATLEQAWSWEQTGMELFVESVKVQFKKYYNYVTESLEMGK